LITPSFSFPWAFLFFLPSPSWPLSLSMLMSVHLLVFLCFLSLSYTRSMFEWNYAYIFLKNRSLPSYFLLSFAPHSLVKRLLSALLLYSKILLLMLMRNFFLFFTMLLSARYC
jgi:hypothetical protein